MILRGSDSYCNFSFGSITNNPNGCLLNPEGSRLIFFEACKKSTRNNFKIFTHLFYTNHLGEPAGFKSSSQLSVNAAWDKWYELHSKGWTEVSHNYG